MQYLLEPYLAGKNIRIEYSKGHHTRVAEAAKNGQIDIAITHIKVKAIQDLVTSGQLIDGQPVFSNPMAFLGPAGDPAGINGLDDAAIAMQRIQEKGFCYVIDPHGIMEKLQRKLLQGMNVGKNCVIDNMQNTREAIQVAGEKNAYTMWGLHPYLAKGKGKLHPVVIPDKRLLQTLGAWVVKGSDVEEQARDLVNYLASDAARERIVKFRFPDPDTIQPWWLPAQSEHTQ